MALFSTLWYSLLALLGLSFRPDAPPPTELRIGTTCSGLQVVEDGGFASCISGEGKNVCRVHCKGEDEGKFTCTEDEGWTPELPKCVKPIEGTDNEEVLNAENAGCPTTSFCMTACRRRGFTRGRCVGRFRGTCECS